MRSFTRILFSILLSVFFISASYASDVREGVVCKNEPIANTVGSLTGRVLDGSGKGVAGVYVFVCGYDSGIPLSSKTMIPFTKKMKSPMASLLYSVTDESGKFSFEKIPVGQYRIVSESWKGSKEIKGAFEVNGEKIVLHGVAEKVKVSSEISASVELRPLGTGVLKFDVDLPNNSTLLVVSTSPTRADPILGFTGWTGKFMQNMVGGNRMPKGRTTVYGLPEGKIYYTMFAADNRPGWIDGRADIKAGKATVVNSIQFVVGWSNGRHHPPKELEEIFAEVKPLAISKDKFIGEVLTKFGLTDNNFRKFASVVGKNLTKEVILPSGRKITFGEFMAACKYVELQRMVEHGKR